MVQALGWMLSVPGASNTVLEAVVPYSRNSAIQLLGKVPFIPLIWVLYYDWFQRLCMSWRSVNWFQFWHHPWVFDLWMLDIFLLFQVPSQFCSPQVTEDMALLAYNRALNLSKLGTIINWWSVTFDGQKKKCHVWRDSEMKALQLQKFFPTYSMIWN